MGRNRGWVVLGIAAAVMLLGGLVVASGQLIASRDRFESSVLPSKPPTSTTVTQPINAFDSTLRPSRTTPSPSATLTEDISPTRSSVSLVTPKQDDTALSTATPDPLAAYAIPVLASRVFGEGDILVRERVETDDPFLRYVIEYPSDGITVTGLMNVPYGEGPFPVVIVLHGYIAPERYARGMDSMAVADYFSWRGYAAIMPDYRGYMGTAGGPNPLRIPYAIDVLHLIESLDTLDVLDAERVGVIGHSMGGGVATYIMVLSERVDAVVLYGAMSADQVVNWGYIGERWSPYWMELTAQLYGSPDTNPEGYARASPINYLSRVQMPVQIHHGMADNQVPIRWSRELAGQLREAGVEVTLYEYEGAGHTFGGEHLVLFLERVFALFEEAVRGGGPRESDEEVKRPPAIPPD